MAELPEEQRDAAAAAFRFLVTSGGRKIALSSEELREFSDADAAPLEPALEHLERARILRRVPAPEPDGVAPVRSTTTSSRPRSSTGGGATTMSGRSAGSREGPRARAVEVRNRRLAAAVVALLVATSRSPSMSWTPDRCSGSSSPRWTAGSPSVRRAPADPRLMLIAVDDRTLDRLGLCCTGRGPGILPRAAYARMLERFREDGAAAIAIDVIFEGAHRPWNDSALLAAIRANRDRVVLASASYNPCRMPRATRCPCQALRHLRTT